MRRIREGRLPECGRDRTNGRPMWSRDWRSHKLIAEVARIVSAGSREAASFYTVRNTCNWSRLGMQALTSRNPCTLYPVFFVERGFIFARVNGI